MSFAPPPNLNADPPPSTIITDDATGEDVYARRVQLSQLQRVVSMPGPPSEEPPSLCSPPPSPPRGVDAESTRLPQVFMSRPNAAAPDITRAPVRYNLPAPPSEIPESEAELYAALQQEAIEPEQEATETDDAPRSLRPGQKGFAERLMNKYGWSKGAGLGVDGTGITSALRVQVEKQKKKPDSEGGGFVGPGGRGKIIGGKRKDDQEGGKFGPMSEVIILRGMVDGMDLDREMAEGELMQEIGEECGDKVSSSLCGEDFCWLIADTATH